MRKTTMMRVMLQTRDRLRAQATAAGVPVTQYLEQLSLSAMGGTHAAPSPVPPPVPPIVAAAAAPIARSPADPSIPPVAPAPAAAAVGDAGGEMMSLAQARDFLPLITIEELQTGSRIVRKWVATVPGLTLPLLLQALAREPYCRQPSQWLPVLDDALAAAAARPSGKAGNAMRLLVAALDKARGATPALPGLVPDAGLDAVIVATGPGPDGRTRRLDRPQSAEQVAEYLKTQCILATPAQCHAFLDYWESMGWVNKHGQPIRDWRAAARYWIRREQQAQLRGAGGPGRANMYGGQGLPQHHVSQHDPATMKDDSHLI